MDWGGVEGIYIYAHKNFPLRLAKSEVRTIISLSYLMVEEFLYQRNSNCFQDWITLEPGQRSKTKGLNSA